MPLLQYPWRARWQVARFRRAAFHVDLSSQASGRRIAQHETPKRNIPYSEDMGRRAKRHILEGYIIMRPGNFNYLPDRDALINALEADGPGLLVHPLLPSMQVLCEHYTVSETREKGGMATFSMTFIEAGQVGDLNRGVPSSVSTVGSAATAADSAAQASLDTALGAGPPLAAGSPA